MLLGLRRRRKRLPPKPVVSMASDAPSGLRAPGGKMMTFDELHAYKAAQMAQMDKEFPGPMQRLVRQIMRDPHYTEKK